MLKEEIKSQSDFKVLGIGDVALQFHQYQASYQNSREQGDHVRVGNHRKDRLESGKSFEDLNDQPDQES